MAIFNEKNFNRTLNEREERIVRILQEQIDALKRRLDKVESEMRVLSNIVYKIKSLPVFKDTFTM